MAYHSRYDSSGRVMSSSQRPLPNNKQQSQERDIHATGGIGAHSLSRRAAANLRLRPRGHWGLARKYMNQACNYKTQLYTILAILEPTWRAVSETTEIYINNNEQAIIHYNGMCQIRKMSQTTPKKKLTSATLFLEVSKVETN